MAMKTIYKVKSINYFEGWVDKKGVEVELFIREEYENNEIKDYMFEVKSNIAQGLGWRDYKKAVERFYSLCGGFENYNNFMNH